MHNKKADTIMNHMHYQVGKLLMSSNTIVSYHEESKEQFDSGKSSIGSISSADNKDLELLLSGEHQY